FFKLLFHYIKLFCFLFVSALPQNANANYPTLDEISLEQTQQLFVDADELGPQEYAIAARPVYAKEQLIGFVALSHEIIKIWGYSRKPIAILIGINIDAHIRGANILYHQEPILVVGIKEEQLHDFVKQFEGKHANTKIRVDAYNREGYEGVDGISGATITVMVLNRSIMGTAKNVASKLGLPRVLKTSGEVVEPASEEAVEQVNEEVAEPANEEVTEAMAIATEELPVWEYNWRENAFHLITMGLSLITLLAILFLQDMLVRRIRLFNIVRISFLLFTVFYIGFWQMAQLSVINILAFSKTVFDGFSWYALMFDFPFYSPLIFMLWAFIALVSLLWGGGVFCGWLCPYGAIQELIGKLADRFKLPSFEFP
ncbi:MAG: 4Fe-4S binding protein, partial [Anaerolineales bacterium]|nr:4Fe-4S binding protein [Anaerolineales bacterium]